jgi:hypothetical protein
MTEIVIGDFEEYLGLAVRLAGYSCMMSLRSFHLSFLNDLQISGWGRGDPEEVDQTARGHSRPNGVVRVTSDLPPTATQEPTFRLGGFVPKPDVQ